MVATKASNAADDGKRSIGIVPADLKEELSRSYIEYAMSVIMGRAMPDVRDGLKPVHRRILYAMHSLGLSPGSRFRKSARVVGEVLGKYHPHGDSAVYDALVRMSQSFSMRAPLVDGHGNFGSTDGDPAAAMRYTECRLTPITRDALFADITKNTVKFEDNFDGSESEPLVLPARVPNLLLNGSSGIAVGLATNIPPHNLGELVAALTAIIRNPKISDNELFKLVPAPDFPTGALILGRGGAQDMYTKGRGQIVMRARAHKETIAKSKTSKRSAIVVTELPYQVNKAGLISKVAELVNTKKLEGIADLRDESDRKGTRIVFEVKRDYSENLVLNNLFKKTDLQTTFSANVMALDSGRFPVSLTLRACLFKFLEFRRETVRRRAQFDLDAATARAHIVDGFLVVQSNSDEIVKCIKSCTDPKSAKAQLCQQFELSEKQAESVLSMQLRRLTSFEQQKLLDEKAQLVAAIEEHSSVLADPKRVDGIIETELKEIKRLHAGERKSEILDLNDSEVMMDIDEQSLVPNEHSIIIVTDQGYVKRLALNEFDVQLRGTKGKRGVGQLRKDDIVAQCFNCMSHDKLLVVSKKGSAYDVQAYKVPVASTNARGAPVFKLLPDFEAGQGMAAVVPVSVNEPDEYLILVTKKGQCIRTELSQFHVNNVRGKRIMSISRGDELRWVRRCRAGDSLLIASESGRVLRLNTDDIPLTKRGAVGVLTMKLDAGDTLAGMDVMPAALVNRAFALLVASNGIGKRITMELLPQRVGRRGKGAWCIKFKTGSNTHVVSLLVCTEEDSVMLATKNGTIVRQRVEKILPRSKKSRGIAIQKLTDGDVIAAVSIIPSELADDDENI